MCVQCMCIHIIPGKRYIFNEHVYAYYRYVGMRVNIYYIYAQITTLRGDGGDYIAKSIGTHPRPA